MSAGGLIGFGLDPLGINGQPESGVWMNGLAKARM
jgi:hypothetical protein